jgi:hypothetical protein
VSGQQAPLPDGEPGVQALPPVGTYSASAGSGGTSYDPSVSNWVVTGVLESGNERVAILRNGEARRIVRQGDPFDDSYIIWAVSREGVELRRGRQVLTLYLGGGQSSDAPALPVASADGPAPEPRTDENMENSRPLAVDPTSGPFAAPGQAAEPADQPSQAPPDPSPAQLSKAPIIAPSSVRAVQPRLIANCPAYNTDSSTDVGFVAICSSPGTSAEALRK